MPETSFDRPLDPRVAGLEPSATLAARERAIALARQGKRIFRLGLGQSPFPVPLPVVEALRAHAAEKDYLSVRGLAALRAAVADYHRRRHGVARGDEDVIVGPGSKELMFLLHICYAGEWLVPTPAWVSYAPQARIAGRRMRYLRTLPEENFRLRPEVVEAACRTEPIEPRILVLNYPSNPVGSTYTEHELLALADVCRRHHLVVLSDEIYGELDFRGAHVSIARFYEEGTILSSGLSKWCGAGGWRLGTFCFPPRLRWLADSVAAVGSETYSTTSAPIQFAAVRAFRGGPEIENYLHQSRRVLSALMPWAAAKLREVGISVTEPSGAFYLLPGFTPHRDKLLALGVRTDVELAERLLEDVGVSCLAGSEFGLSPEDLYLRLALVDFDGARALAAAAGGVEIDEGFIRGYLAPVHAAILALASWV